MTFDEIKIYLPKFLSAESERDLFLGLRDFPDNIDKRLYTTYLDGTDIIYQGDGLNNLLVVNIPNTEIKPAPGIILSNTCDIDIQNIRNFPSQIVYAPIFNLAKYNQALIKASEKSESQIFDHIESIKRQEITQIYYLPKYEGRLEESIVFLDRVNNMPNNSVDRKNIKDQRIFTLSDYGIYLFILKLSIHFTRIQDKVERRSDTNLT